MAKATLVLPDGTKVDIDGTVEEVGKLLATFSSAPAPAAKKKASKRKGSSKPTGSSGKKGSTRKGPQVLIGNLAEEGFFRGKKHTIGDIQKKLEEKGHIYAQQSLSTPLLRLTRNKTLRRLKEKSGWVYVS